MSKFPKKNPSGTHAFEKGEKMKKVIRQSVFETNSSSTHSFTIKKSSDKKDKCAFVLKSPISKMVWYLGLCNNAQKEHSLHDGSGMSEQDLYNALLKRMKQVWESNEELRETYADCGEDAYLTWDVKMLDRVLWCWDEDYGEFCEEEQIDVYVLNEDDRELVCAIKDALIAQFAKLNEVSVEDAYRLIWEEACRDYETEKLLEGAQTDEEIIKRLCERSVYIKYEFENATDKSALIDKYTGRNCQNCDCACDHYFENGALNDCFCGFESYFDMAKKMTELAKSFGVEANAQTIAELLLSDKVIIEGHEDYSGICPIHTNTEY